MRSRPTRPSLFPETTPRPTPPPTQSGWITAYCDGGARGNPGPSGYGAEITGPDGAVLGELSEFLGIRTNNYAEYSGLLASLQFALDHHHPRLRVVSDSELMVKQIQGKYKVNSPELKLLWQEARSRIARLEAFEISHALRHKNKAADALANQAMDRGMNRQSTPPAISTGAIRPAVAATRPAVAARANPQPTRAVPQTEAQAQAQSPPQLQAPPRPGFLDPRADPMLRGFTRDGVVHILGGVTLPDGIFVKVIRE